MRIKKILFLLIMGFAALSCGETPYEGQVSKLQDHNMDIIDVVFDEDCKHFHVDVVMADSVTTVLLNNDSTIVFSTEEYVEGHNFNPRTQPVLTSYENILAREISELNLNVLVLADLTLDQEGIDTQEKAIKRFKQIFSMNEFRIAFMGHHGISETMDASDYVLDNYFRKVEGEKYLYRSILSKINEVNRHPHYYSHQADTTLRPEQDIMIVFSDGKVYEDDSPVDPDYFNLQSSIVSYCASGPDFPVYYVNMNRDSNSVVDNSIMELLCASSGGKYHAAYDYDEVMDGIMSLFDRQYADYRFTFANPDLKIYRGMECSLHIECRQGEEILASDNIKYHPGSIYSPVIVSGPSTIQVILQGCIIGLSAIFIFYLLMQFLVPYISYLVFQKKYVVRYTGKGMCVNGIQVPESCYLCRAPFEPGEKIVVKCSHVLHQDCWDDNEYKCPEYGRNCRHGSHFYDRKNLMDSRNASFYLKWVLAGSVAALIAWILLTIYSSNEHENPLITGLVAHIIGTEQATRGVYYLPAYGISIGFLLTMALSILTTHSLVWWKNILIILSKSLTGMIFCGLSFMFGSVVSASLNIEGTYLLVDCIPWMLSGFIIAFTVSFGTDIKLRKALIGAAVSIVFSIGSMYLWSFAFSTQLDTRVFLLLSYIFYCVGLAVSIAATSPKSEKYFLKVEGPIKTMEVALYKWIRSSFVRRRIIIGRSVDCELQMTWDIMGDIAPEQAEVRMVGGEPYLVAIEAGVFIGNNRIPLKAGEKKRLYHNTRFFIGNTTFTYIEKDI